MAPLSHNTSENMQRGSNAFGHEKCDLFFLFQQETQLGNGFRGFLYFLALGYCFIGLSAITARFFLSMENVVKHTRAVEEFDSYTNAKVVKYKKVWNYAIADITLLAFGTSFPQISLATIDAIRNIGNLYAGGLGPGTLVGSAAFDLFPIHAVCVVVLKAGELKKISDIGVWLVELFWSFWAYIWLYIILQVWTPNIITLWEASLTVLQFGLLLIHAYAQDKRWPYLSLPIARTERPEEWVPPETAPLKGNRAHDKYSDIELCEDRNSSIVDIFSIHSANTGATQICTSNTRVDIINEWHTDSRDCHGIIHNYTRIGHAIGNLDLNVIGLENFKRVSSKFAMIQNLPVEHLWKIRIELRETKSELYCQQCDESSTQILLIWKRHSKHALTRLFSLEMTDDLEQSREETMPEKDNLLSIWKQQFIDAVTLESPESRKLNNTGLRLAKGFWKLLHAPWRLLFAFVPPYQIAHGWIAFIFSLCFISGIAYIVTKFTDLISCVTGINAYVIAFTALAAGTSWPDLVASKIAAERQITADSAIANITCSNSVNIYIGIGVPWLIDTLYNFFAYKEPLRIENAKGLSFSLLVFFATSVGCIGVLIFRRLTLGAELGGPKSWAWLTCVYLMLLWLIFVVLSSLRVSNII